MPIRLLVTVALIGGSLLTMTNPSFGQSDSQVIRVGVIGLDTSHAIAFTKLLNDESNKDHVPGCKVVCAFPHGSPDIESSVSRIPQYTEQIQELGVEVVDSIETLLSRVDAVLLETNDGRPHLEQARQVIAAKKPMFIDKPVAGSLKDAILIYREAEAAGVPVFSSSSLRFVPGALAARAGEYGEVTGCDTYSPASLEPTHPDLFWYGIHGVESLYTVMGPGCETVTRTSTEYSDSVVGKWSDGRIGTFRGIRASKLGYGGTVYTKKQIEEIGPYAGYAPLVVEIVKFFQGGKPPVSARETVELYAFMEAADESKRQDGVPVSIAETLEKAGLRDGEFGE
ncbi:MAG: Gfo/Idh/MocA family oxidoreductase [Planctomycetaceae bacterium]|nr:Gfo/Idh/MocA family oxidoreductase [Planctomycetaceae bacterium]